MWANTVWGLAGFAFACFLARLSVSDAVLRIWLGYGAALFAICGAGVFAWPFVPVWRGRWFGGLIAVRDAARTLYEACEGTTVGAYLKRMYQEPEGRLSHIFHFFEAYGVPLFAASPPSRTLRKIEWAGGNLMLLPDSSDLAFVGTHSKPAYRNASIRQRDLRRLIRQLRKTDPRDLR